VITSARYTKQTRKKKSRKKKRSLNPRGLRQRTVKIALIGARILPLPMRGWDMSLDVVLLAVNAWDARVVVARGKIQKHVINTRNGNRKRSGPGRLTAGTAYT
jgi:hypothetical protein